MARPRVKFRSLRVTPEFRDFVLDQLARIPQLRAKAMFGGVGLYSADAFFGIVAADELFFKVDASNRSAYEAAGTGELATWALAAIRAAGNAAAKKPRRKAKKPAKRKPRKAPARTKRVR